MTEPATDTLVDAGITSAVDVVVIHTDGACKGNPGPGGWGAVLQAGGGHEKELWGGEPNTTNNRMELMPPSWLWRP